MAEHADSTSGGAAAARAPTLNRDLRVIVVTPEATVLEEAADFVALPLYDGEIGIGRGHSPMIGRLGYGEMRVRNASGTRRWFIDGGFVEVADNVVSVLTNRAIPSAEIDPQVAAEQLEAARSRPAQSEELRAERERTASRARAKLRVARAAK